MEPMTEMGMNRLQIGKRLWLWVQPMEADIWQGILGAAVRMLLWMAATAAGLFGVAGFFSRCLEKIEPECRSVSCCCMMWMTPAGRSI